MPLVNDVYQVLMVGRCLQQLIILTHYYRVVTFDVGVTDDQIRDTLLTKVRAGAGGSDILESKYLDCMPSNYVLTYIQSQKVSVGRRRAAQATRGTPGTVADSATTANLASTITLTTELAGRNQQATKHVGPLPNGSDQFEDGLINPLYGALLSAFRARLLTGVVDIPLSLQLAPCIYHKPGPVFSTDVIDGSIGDTVRVMRRRTVGVGK